MKAFASIIVIALAISLTYQFSEYNFIKFWDYSRIAYCNPQGIKEVNCGPYCNQYRNDLEDIRVIKISSSDNQAFVAYSKEENSLVLTFRGSSNLKNWISDLDALKTKYSKCGDCEIHEGFLKAYKTMENQIITNLSELSAKYSGLKELIITGHSLGGALTTVAAGELGYIYNLKKVYSYASPRVGDKHYYKWWMNIKMGERYRVTHHDDIVVHLPMEFAGFNHVDEEVWYYEKNSMNTKHCPQNEDPDCADSVHWLSASDHTTYLMRPTTEETSTTKFKQCRGSNAESNDEADEIRYQEKILEIQNAYLKELKQKQSYKNSYI